MRTIWLGPGALVAPPSWAADLALDLDRLGAEAALPWSTGAEVVVSAGPHAPGALAARLAGEAPLWVDLPGDPYAELHAALSLPEAQHATPAKARRAAAHAAARAALARADALGVISAPQRHAALGQLGLLERLDVPVAVTPVAWDFGVPAQAPRPWSRGGPLGVALTGSLNTWLDTDALLDGLDRALRALPALTVVWTGPDLPDHHRAGGEALRRWADRHAGRVQRLGLVPQQALGAALRPAHLSLNLDRPVPEAELGSRTRLLFAVHQGLWPLSTPGCALAQEGAAEGWLLPLPTGDAEALSQAVQRLAAIDDDGAGRSAAQARLAERYAPARAYAPLLDWVARPRRVAPGSDPLAALSDELADARAALRAVHDSPTWRLLDAARGTLRRFTQN